MASIRTSGYYNDPAIGQAAQNLASLFAPPSGADAAGWASANAKRAEAERLASLFTYAQAPGFNQQQFDRMGVAAGNFAPTQSYYAVDTNNATARRGQDVSAATSRANNAATVRGGVISNLYGALNPGQVRPDVPVDIAGAVGLPAMPGVAGIQKPLSKTEWDAQEASRLQGTGALTDQMLLDTINGKESPVQAVGPDGKTPVFMTPGAAVRTGAQPFVNRGAEAKPQNYLTPDGRRGTAAVGPGGALVDSQNGQPVPQGSVVFGTNVQGTADEVGMKTTEAQDRAGYAAVMSEGATRDVVAAYKDPALLPSGGDYQMFALLRQMPAQFAPLIVQNMSPAGQKFYQDIRSALPYQLMVQSGQAVTEPEYDRKLLELTPIPGEAAGALAGKQRQFEQYLRAIRGMAGPAYQKAGGTSPLPGKGGPPAVGAPASPEQQPAAVLRYNPATGRIE